MRRPLPGTVVGPLELVLAYADGMAKARAAKARLARQRARWTQEDWNEFYEKRFHEQNEKDYRKGLRRKMPTRKEKREALELALMDRRPVPPPSARIPNDAARMLAKAGWRGAKADARRKQASEALKNGRINPSWNLGMRKENSQRMKYISDLLKWKIEVNTKLGYWPS
jgi:hypothetical protein